jgi:NADH:ubiquinone reductase (H+-translocating)
MNGKALPRVVIVGAGFGGLNAAQSLAKAQAQVTVIDRRNHHTFQPLLYQVATAGLSPGEIASPIRSLFRSHKNVEVVMAEVTGFDLEQRIVHTPDVAVPYDYLVVAGGASHAYFGHEEWAKFAPGLKSVEDAIEIRRRILLAFELAERQTAAGEPAPPLNFVIVGAGPTGVELAGTLAEICRHALKNEYRMIDPARAHILLLEGGPRVLPAYPADLSTSAQEQLNRLGVDVRTSTMVTQIEAGVVHFGDTRLDAAVVLWAAGVAASPLGKKLSAETDRAGRVPVQHDLSLPNHPEVFVIGDLAAVKGKEGKMLPGVAPVAIQQGRFVAKLIRNEIKLILRDDKNEDKSTGRDVALVSKDRPASRASFHYWDKGNIATIGRAAAVAEFGKIHISGFVAWLSWLLVHIFFLIGFRNRILVFVQWAWSYVTYERGARLITGSNSLPGWTDETHMSPRPNDQAKTKPVASRAESNAKSQPQEIHANVTK